MRNVLLTLLFSIAAVGFSSGQMGTEFTRSNSRMVAPMSLPDEVSPKDIQAKFHLQEWSDGVVSFKNTPQQLQRPLIFDIYNNQLYYLENGQIMEFSNPIYQFSMKLVNGKDTNSVLFRSGYPNIERNTDTTFYEVLIDGKFQLLKCRSKSVLLYKDIKADEEKRGPSKELFFTYLPNTTIVLIKKDRKHILQQMPEYATAIQSVLDSHKLKLKNEASLKQLFLMLNTSSQ